MTSRTCIYKPGQVWITTDGTAVYVRSALVTSKKRGKFVFISPIFHGVVRTMQHRWHADDLAHLQYEVPVKIEPDETAPLHMGRVSEPWRMGRYA